jgi:Uncharacterized protein conserved in bacteria (DUF2188)
MTRYIRVVERPDGGWACRRGSEDYDVHATLRAAIEHVKALADETELAEVFLQRADGTLEALGPLSGEQITLRLDVSVRV